MKIIYLPLHLQPGLDEVYGRDQGGGRGARQSSSQEYREGGVVAGLVSQHLQIADKT